MKFSWNIIRNYLFLLSISSLFVFSSAATIKQLENYTSPNSNGNGTDIIGNERVSLENNNTTISLDTTEISSTTPPLSVEPEIETLVPTWAPSTTQKRQRATKLLEKPLESQLFQLEKRRGGGGEETEAETNDRENFLVQSKLLFTSLTPSIKSSGNFAASSSSPSVPQSSNEIPIVRVSGTQGRTSSVSMKGVRRRLLKPGVVPNRKQEVAHIPLENEGPLFFPSQIEFNSPTSPLEASLGGLSGFFNLPPLSFIQFVKILVAITPFIIPIIFIPLLIFTIGILMIPVTRSNVFVDWGDFRRSSSMANDSQSIISSYLVSPVKKFTGSVVMPRAYQFASEIIDHEECVERISCEISARYLHHSEWNGSLRSVANANWISRVISYLGGNRPTLLRIAKSLHYWNINSGIMDHGKSGENAWGNSVDEGDTSKREEKTDHHHHHHQIFGKRSENRERNGISGRTEHERHFTSDDTSCRKYVCEPRTFLRKLFFS